jgi:argininosuccinate lyase
MITSYFFTKLIEHLNNYHEIEFSFTDTQNLEFDKYLYEMTFISSIYYSFELINQQSYKSAEALLLQIIATLQKVYDDTSITSVMKGDDDFELIEILMYDSIARLYYEWSEQELSDFDYTNEANVLLEKAA